MSKTNLKDLEHNRIIEVVTKAQRDPCWFVRVVLGCQMWEKQRMILESIRDHDETVVASCHGAGKSWTAAVSVLWFLFTHRHSIVITTAPGNRQVKGILWKEIRRLHQQARFPLGGRVIQQEIKVDTDWFAWGFTASDHDPDKFQGFHSSSGWVLVVVDESSGVSNPIFEAIDGVLSSEYSRLLLIGNPTNPMGRFAKSFVKNHSAHKINISAFDTPNFRHFKVGPDDIESGSWKKKVGDKSMPFPMLVTPKWAAERQARYGKRSPWYVARVLGRFPSSRDDTLIPLTWLTQAQGKLVGDAESLDGLRIVDSPLMTALGVDVARYGQDRTVFTVLQIHEILCGDKDSPPEFFSQITCIQARDRTSVTEVATEAQLISDTYRCDGIAVDDTGVGGGVTDILQDAGLMVEPVLFGSASSETDEKVYINLKAELFWSLRRAFEKGQIGFDTEDETLESEIDIMVGQLSMMLYEVTPRGIRIIDPDESAGKRKALGDLVRSPDYAHSLGLAWWYAKIGGPGSVALTDAETTSISDTKRSLFGSSRDRMGDVFR